MMADSSLTSLRKMEDDKKNKNSKVLQEKGRPANLAVDLTIHKRSK